MAQLIGKSWWTNFRFNHKQIRKRSPENSKAGAKAYEAVLRTKLARGEDIGEERETAVKERLFETFAWKWFDEYVLPNNKYSERRAKRYILNASLVPFFGKTPLDEITEQQVEQYKALLVKQGIGRKTINNRLTVLRKCLWMGYEWLRLDKVPPRIKKLRCAPSRTEFLTEEECSQLLGKTDGQLRELVLVALRTGMRQGEIKGLQWESIDWENNQIVVRHSYCDYRKVLDTPKSNRERVIPLHGDVYSVLSRRRKNMGYVFVNQNKQPFNDKSLERRLTKLCKQAGVKRVTWHILRHTFASHLAMKGVPLNAVQTLLGHTSIATTMRYAHVAPSTLRTAINLLAPQTLFSEDFGQPVGNQWIEAKQRELKNAAPTS